jgi:hypothetical protein
MQHQIHIIKSQNLDEKLRLSILCMPPSAGRLAESASSIITQLRKSLSSNPTVRHDRTRIDIISPTLCGSSAQTSSSLHIGTDCLYQRMQFDDFNPQYRDRKPLTSSTLIPESVYGPQKSTMPSSRAIMSLLSLIGLLTSPTSIHSCKSRAQSIDMYSFYPTSSVNLGPVVFRSKCP